MVKITVGIDGMACGMCEAHINDAVRNAFPVKKVTSSHTKRETVILADREIPEQELRKVVAEAGYDVMSVNREPYEKRGLFSRNRGKRGNPKCQRKRQNFRKKSCQSVTGGRRSSSR